jgi:photosystem II stability/assembly factor-like uncharacterized protein
MKTPAHTSSPACATFAPLLPLATQGMLAGTRAAALEEHLAGCAHCREELAGYAELDAALRQAVAAPPGARPPFAREEIAEMLLRSNERKEAPVRSVGNEDGGPRRRWLAGLSAVAAVLLISVLAQALFAWHRGPGGGLHASHPTLPAQIELKSLSMDSATEGWAVGNTTPRPDPKYAGFLDTDPVMLHYLNGTWSVVPNPTRARTAGASVILTSVSMDSPSDGWAVGHSVHLTVPGVIADGATMGITLHYTGGQWTVADEFYAYAPTSVFMRAADDGWIVGDADGMVLHYDGRAWTPAPVPLRESLLPAAVSGFGGGDVWVAATDYGASANSSGFDGNAPEVVLYYHGQSWTRESLPDPHVRISQFAMTSPTVGWAVGVLPRPTGPSGSGDATKPDNAIILRYQAGTWEEQARFAGPVNTSTSFNDIAMVSANEGWAMGTGGLIVHYAQGTWSPVSSPTSQTLRSIALISDTDGWAVGDGGTILRYSGGAWSPYQA